MATIKDQLLKLSDREITEQLTQHEIVPFLDEKSLYELTWTCKHYHNKYKNMHADKKVAAEMLHCVLNPTLPNQNRFLELLSTPKKDLNGLPLYLIQNNGEEIYFNYDKVQKTKTKRFGVSVLEAILRTHNFHLAKALFNSIPQEEKTRALKKLIKEIKAKGIWGMPELQAAYKEYLDFGKILLDAKKYEELEALCGRVGQMQKDKLPWFSFYLFCHPGVHSTAEYTQPPSWICMLSYNQELDLDRLGKFNTALFKGNTTHCDIMSSCLQYALLDSPAFENQCTVLSSELDKTIKEFDLDLPLKARCVRPGSSKFI